MSELTCHLSVSFLLVLIRPNGLLDPLLLGNVRISVRGSSRTMTTPSWHLRIIRTDGSLFNLKLLNVRIALHMSCKEVIERFALATQLFIIMEELALIAMRTLTCVPPLITLYFLVGGRLSNAHND